MRCDCCDKALSDEEATARFVETGNYVSMCSKCRSFLPKNIPGLQYAIRPDLSNRIEDDQDGDMNYFDDGELDGYEED